MNRLRKLIVNIVAVLMVVASCFTLTACKEDIKTVELKVSVYNYAESVADFEEVTLTIDLYRHLAPNTVDTVIKYIKEGYYNDAIFYKHANHTNQIMLGDLKQDSEGNIVQNAIKPQIKGEFEHGGTSGSNLTPKKGSIGLWRNWYAYDDSYQASNDAMHSGRSIWFMPTQTSTSSLSGYSGWFCIFAQFDVNSQAYALIENAIKEHTEDYVVYYTGEWDESKADANYGLTYNCVPAGDFEEDDIEDLFVADESKAHYTCYNYYTVKLPVREDASNNSIAAKVISAKVK